MESLTEKIKDFLAVDYGYGYGEGSGFGSDFEDGDSNGCEYHNGNGDGYGDGNGFGYGDGYGHGYNDGHGYGGCYNDGYGYGSRLGNRNGNGVKIINGNSVYPIDNILTIISAIHGNIARGAILNHNMTLTPCYIVKQDNKFAHGKTLRDAMAALREKLFYDMPEEERINAFLAEHKAGVEYPCQDLYEWHNRLTGSCEMGRKQFAKDHGIDIEKDSMTVERFIELTRNAYGGDIIKKVEEAYQDGNINSRH